MRTRLVLGALLIAVSGVATVVGAQSTATEKTAGGVKASKGGKGPEKAGTKSVEKLNPNSYGDEACLVEDDSYDQLLKGMAQEARALEEFRRQKEGRATQGEYDRCYTAFVQTPTFANIMSGAGSNAKKGAKVEEALEHKCGQNPRTQWTKENIKRRLNLVEFNGSEYARMDQKCYAQFKEVAAFFCNLDKEAQDYAMENGIELPGRGKAKWKFSAKHATLIAPRCIDLKLGLNSVENPPSTKR